jgi:hypothetical protein
MGVVTAVAFGLVGKNPVTLAAIGRNVAIFVACYLFVFAMGFVVNMARAPVLLDQERAAQIGILDNKLVSAEAKGATVNEQKEFHSVFAALMQGGHLLADNLRVCMVKQHFSEWDRRAAIWKDVANKKIIEIGLPTEAVAFIHAGEKAVPIQGIVNWRHEQESRRRTIQLHIEKLEEIAQRH